MSARAKPSTLPFNDVDNIEIGVSEKFLVKNETVHDPTLLWSPQSNYFTTGVFYAFAGLSFLTLLYFAFQAIRVRRRRDKVRRYGVIASREDVEMTPLDNEDDDEDATVFDITTTTTKS